VKLCEDMEAEHMALRYYFETRWFSCAKELHSIFELKQEIAVFCVRHIKMLMQIYVTMKMLFRNLPIW
jgi:hypothetical protein